MFKQVMYGLLQSPGGIIGLSMALMGLYFQFKVIITRIYRWHQETHVYGKLEQQMNAALFQGQKENDSAFISFNIFLIFCSSKY